MKIEDLQRTVVVGSSCSGKTTFAGKLSRITGLQHVELDALYWLPDWVERPAEEFQSLVSAAVTGESWIVDGNYSRVRDVIWSRATAIVWLDYSFPRTVYRAFKRTIVRAATKEVLFSNNRESFRQSFASRDSILLWVLTQYFDKRRRYNQLLRRAENPNRAVFILQTPAATNRFLDRVRRLNQ